MLDGSLRDDWATISEEDREEIEAVAKEFPTDFKMIVAALMIEEEYDDATARKRARKLHSELSRTPPRLEHYRPYVGLDAILGIPTPCGVVLERDGLVARDKKGNPVCLCYGMFETDTASGILQMNYLLHRVSRYIHERNFPSILYVFDLKAREGHHSYTPNLEFVRYCSLFPAVFTFVMCNVPPALRKAWGATAAIVSEKVRNRYVLDDGYGALKEHLTPENMLPEWGGTFQFDIGEYRAMLDRESAE